VNDEEELKATFKIFDTDNSGLSLTCGETEQEVEKRRIVSESRRAGE
jgi:hypothetical protein